MTMVELMLEHPVATVIILLVLGLLMESLMHRITDIIRAFKNGRL